MSFRGRNRFRSFPAAAASAAVIVGSVLAVLFVPTLTAGTTANTCLGFVAVERVAVFPRGRTSRRANRNRLASSSDDSSSSSSSAKPPAEVFPVLRQIEGVNWEGTCRYANDELVPASFQLTGGIRFDLSSSSSSSTTGILDTVEMNSFVVFPNGKSREITMRYVL